MMVEIRTYPDAAGVAQAAAEQFVARAQEAASERGAFRVALSGGSTPKLMLQLLATEAFIGRVDWPRVHIFWGDERPVAPEHADSNYHMAHEALLEHVPLPEANIHRIRGETEPAQAAAEYEQVLRAIFGSAAFARFDLFYLGMGSDGHTASLFPQSAALSEQERWVIENRVEKLDTWRITLTVPVINAAARVIFLVTGADKSERLHEVLHGPHDPQRLPAQFIEPAGGDLLWLIDAEAAARL